MDNLLERLRRDMAELSVQGDDFTRQIWRMYGTFEQMLAHHDQTSGRMTLNLFPEMRMNYMETLPAFHAWSHNAENHSAPGVSVNASYSGLGSSEEYLNDDLGLDLTVRPRMQSMSGNPLLETISAIEDSSESDECEYLHVLPNNHVAATGNGSIPASAAHHQQPVTTRSAEFLLTSSAHISLQGDKDFFGYAGSNSIDSGYKSSCPTPDLSDYHPTGHDGKRGSIASVGSSASLNYASQQPANKLRIAMGTRVMATAPIFPNNHRQPATTVTQLSSPVVLPDPNSLDHLLSLRHSLMSAIQRYESAVQRRAVSTANIAVPELDESPVHHNNDIRPQPGACPRSSRHRSRSPSYYRPRSQSASSSTSSTNQKRSSPALHRKQNRQNRPGSPLVGGEGTETRDSPSRRVPKAALALPPVLPTRTYGLQQPHQQQPVLPQRAPRISDEGIAALLSVAASKLQATHANQERSGSFSRQQPAGQASYGDQLEKQATRDEKGAAWTGNNKLKMEQGEDEAATFMLEGEIDALLYGRTGHRYAAGGSAKVSSVSQLKEQVQKMAQQASALTDQPEDVRSRFSRVARCMLDIIEDLHKQSLDERAAEGHQRWGANVADNTGSKQAAASALLLGNSAGQRGTSSKQQPRTSGPSGGASGSKLNVQAQQQQQVLLRSDSACPANPSKRVTEEQLADYGSSSNAHCGSGGETTLLAGADYHVYEEILYDWTTTSSHHYSTSQPQTTQPHHSTPNDEFSQQPPPLPSRPATLAKPKFDFDKFLIRTYPSQQTGPHDHSVKEECYTGKKITSQQSLSSTQSSRSLWDQLMGTKLMHGCGTGSKMSNLSRPPTSKPKGNVYTMFHDRERKPATGHIEHEPDKELPKEVIEDEYGFRIVTHLV